MTRSLTGLQLTEIGSSGLYISYCLSIKSSPELNLWQGVGDLDDGVRVYQGVDDLISLSSVSESSDLSDNSMSVALSGLSENIKPLLTASNTLGLFVELGVAILDNNLQLVDDIVIIKSGYIDHLSSQSGDKITTVTAKISGLGVRLTSSSIIRHTNPNQQELHPGDTILENQASLADREITWKFS